MNVSVKVLGTAYEVSVEKLRDSMKYRVSGRVKGELVQIERVGYNAALATWKVIVAKKLQA
jgi:hypothetical protein